MIDGKLQQSDRLLNANTEVTTAYELLRMARASLVDDNCTFIEITELMSPELYRVVVEGVGAYLAEPANMEATLSKINIAGKVFTITYYKDILDGEPITQMKEYLIKLTKLVNNIPTPADRIFVSNKRIAYDLINDIRQSVHDENIISMEISEFNSNVEHYCIYIEGHGTCIVTPDELEKTLSKVSILNKPIKISYYNFGIFKNAT